MILPTAPDSANVPAMPAERAALPPDDELREELHNEVHARPAARIRLPALVVYVAVLNQGVTREQECEHLRKLPGQDHLTTGDLKANFLRLRMDGFTLKWERHTEFTRYSLVQPLPEGADLDSQEPVLPDALVQTPDWFAGIPGRTVAAVKLTLLAHDISDPHAVLARGQQWLGARNVVASLLGNGHSLAITDFRLRPTGFERILVVAPPQTSPTRVGRISSRLLEMETYRLMALRGLPISKQLAPTLNEAESTLSNITALMEQRQASDQALLDTLIHEAARIERATADHGYRFAATQAYGALVRQRLTELREIPIPGTQMLGEFMQHRLSPALATVAATAQRLASLSQRIERAGALLRTRVDIASEAQNQLLLAKLTRGQELQLNLQTTVEGLSIAAISYYVISLLLYGGKALKAIGLPINPEMLAGALVPVVLWGVWKATQRIHAKLHGKA
jgi:uncharacterized membrane-anchored protein